MSFRKEKNKNNEWLKFKNKFSESFKIFTDESLDAINQKSFEKYLTEGSNENFHTPINELNNNDFLTLEKIVNEWESFQIGFDSFYNERIKRFYRYG